MIWLLALLVIFWKPLFWLSKGVYVYFSKKDPALAYEQLLKIKDWLVQLWSLVKP